MSVTPLSDVTYKVLPVVTSAPLPSMADSLVNSSSPNATAGAEKPTTVAGQNSGEHTLIGPVAVAWEAMFDGPQGDSDAAISVVLGSKQKSLFVTGTLTTGPLQDGTWPRMAFGSVAYDARTGERLWLARYENLLLPVHKVIDMAASRNGRLLVVTGYAWRNLDAHIATLALDPNTGAELWNSVYAADRWQQATDLAISPDNKKVFIVGVRKESTPDGYLSGATDAVVMSFDAKTGDILWRDVYEPEQDQGSYAASVAVSPDSRALYVIGSRSIGGNPQGRSVITTVGYDAITGEHRWEQRYLSLTDHSIVVDKIIASPDGRTLYVTAGMIERDPPWNASLLLMACDAATGAERWIATRPLGVGRLGSVRATLGANGRRIFIAGYDYRNETDLGDFRVVAYDVVHKRLLWETSYGTGAGQSEYPADIAVNQSGRMVVVTGRSGTPSLPLGRPTDPPSPPVVRSYATVGYDARSGELLWAAHYLGPAGRNGMGASVAIGKKGRRVFVTGFTDGLTGPPGGNEDYFTVAYDVLMPHKGRERDGGNDDSGRATGKMNAE